MLDYYSCQSVHQSAKIDARVDSFCECSWCVGSVTVILIAMLASVLFGLYHVTLSFFMVLLVIKIVTDYDEVEHHLLKFLLHIFVSQHDILKCSV